jgi:ABC-type multidrug transport system fused ATPase/permease subunit
VDGVDLSAFSIPSWRGRLTAVFQDFTRFELPLRDNVAPAGAPDEVVLAALEAAGASKLAELDTVLARGSEGGTDLSGGQWQRVALARALCAVKLGAVVVLLDEPTAALDAETEHALFERYAAAARSGDGDSHRITILVSHRFSTVRMADLIVVLDGSRVAQVGTHEELMARGGQYAELYGIQAAAYR